jgi:hypothetical protein
MSDVQEKILELMDLFDEDEVTTANKIPRPQSSLDKEAFDDFNIRNPKAGGGMLVQPSADGRRPGYAGKDQYVISDELKEKIKNKIKLKPGQKWNFYNPETGKGHTFGVKKSDDIKLYDRARNIGTPGRLETKLKKATEKYKEIKTNPKLLAQKKAYDRELYMGKRDEILEARRLKYETDKDFREKKLEWARQDKIKNPEKYKQKLNDYFAKKGRFPPGNNYKENVWRDMFRSSQKSGQERFLLVDEKGNLLTEDKFPRIKNKVRWDVGGAYKKIKFYDTVTKQFVKFDNSIKGKGITFEKYLDQKSVGGKGAYKNAINGYKNKDDIKNLTFKDSKGKTIRLGTIVQERLNDGVNFINSGVNVQHSDLNNAFWKNEVTLASSNNKLNYLEQTLERKLKNAGNDISARTKIINNFKSEINKQPGGITKIVEGKTLGVEPTTKSVVEAVGKEFKLTRFKDFNNLLLKLSAQIDSNCAGAIKQASKDGGRIGLKTIGSQEVCITKAKNYMNETLQRGIGTETNVKTSLIKRILSGTANFLKQNLSPKEIFKLENLIGKPALYGAAAFETGFVADDVLRKGKPLNVAAAESLFGDLLNLDADAARAKNLLESNVQLSPAAKEYAQNILDYDRYRKNELSFPASLIAKKMPGSDRYFKMQEDLRNKIENTPDTGAMDYMSALDESEGAFKAKPKFLDAPDKPEITPLTNKFANPPGTRIGPMTAKRDMQIDLSLPTYDRSFTASDEELNQYLKSIGETPLEPGEGTLFRMREPDQRGLFGTQERFADGGLSGGDKSGPPPESGPTPHGLPGILKRVKNI